MKKSVSVAIFAEFSTINIYEVMDFTLPNYFCNIDNKKILLEPLKFLR